jgi:hypothetical protein
MKSIAEIDILERAHSLGAKTLGDAAAALQVRWHAGMRDNETFIRLAFLSWYSRSEPTWYNGLPDSLPDVDELIDELGGLSSVSAESKFVLAALATGFPWCLGEQKRWSGLAIQLPEEARILEPQSVVFSDWRYVFGLQEEHSTLRNALAAEFHARFSGRGYMGIYLQSVFGRRLGGQNS